MKPITCLFFFLMILAKVYSQPKDTADATKILADLEQGNEKIQLQWQLEILKKSREIAALSVELNQLKDQINNGKFPDDETRDKFIEGLDSRIKQYEEINSKKAIYEIESINNKYLKGIELILLLYEKILDLNHLYSALKTNQLIQSLSNPMEYPDFALNQAELKRKLTAKNAINLPDFMQKNPFISSAYSVLSAIIGGGDKKDRENMLDKVNCILDFTSGMTSSLKIIYFETEFLKIKNEELQKSCEKLFQDFTKPIGYLKTLEDFRNNDDRDNIIELLNLKIKALTEASKPGSPNTTSAQSKLKSDLIFNLMILTEFVNQYNYSVDQGCDYYKKFEKMISEYSTNECISKLPQKFSDLRENISATKNKFETAYKIPALKGSKLKEILFIIE